MVSLTVDWEEIQFNRWWNDSTVCKNEHSHLDETATDGFFQGPGLAWARWLLVDLFPVDRKRDLGVGL